MSMQALLRGLVGQAIGAVGDLAAAATYRSHTGSAFDPDIGGPAPAYAECAVRVVMTRPREMQAAGPSDAERDAMVALVAAEDLAGIDPKTTDLLVVGSTIWKVAAVATDPAQALIKITVRR